MAETQELHKLQQEAVQRVQAMQSRARQHLQEEPPQSPEVSPAPSRSAWLPEQLWQDSERTLLLLLVLLLSEEEADAAAMFSLLYLLLE